MSLKEYSKNKLYTKIIDRLIEASSLMTKEYETKVENDENKIRNHLIEKYLNKKELYKENIKILFSPENLEGFDSNTNEYSGRSDIAVFNEERFVNPKNYFIIECKRLDGSFNLNKKYIEEGIYRFVIEKKYKSFYNKSIMFGFIVNELKIRENTEKIRDIHSEDKQLLNIIKKDFVEIKIESNKYGIYSTEYLDNVENNFIEIGHIFYDFSSLIIIT